MKTRILSVLAVMAMTLSSCIIATGNNGVSVNNGSDSDATVKKEINVASFNEIEASQGIKVVVSQGKFPGKISVATTPSAEQYLKVKVNEGTLKVCYENKSMATTKIKGPSIITVTIPELEEADLSSGANLLLKGAYFSNSKMDLDLSSGSYVKIENLSCRELSLDVSSGANATVENFKGNLDADASSGSAISIKQATGGIFTLDASSGASISLNSKSSEEIRSSASSGGSVSLSGRTERLSKQASSGGSVNSSKLTQSK